MLPLKDMHMNAPSFMVVKVISLIAGVFVFAGCQTPSPTDQNRKDWYDRALGKRDNCWGYRVVVEVSDPGCRIEINKEHVATLTNTVGEIILWGYSDGRFRKNQVVRIVANPVRPGQNQQTKTFFNTAGREPIPHQIYFDLNLELTKPTEKMDIKVR
jgi:hypothetical protein